MRKSKSIDIKDILGSRIDGSKLVNDLERIRNRAEPVLAKITETFSDYTIHDIRHSEKVISILSWVIPTELLENMNDYELFFLIASCYLHDIGMADLPELSFENEPFDNIDEKRDSIRRLHHIRSEQFINNNFEKLCIEDEHQARIIGRICRGHREKIAGDLYSNREMYTSKNISVNIPMLASLLKLADDLDLTFERTPKIIYDTLKPKSEVSKDEWARHLSTCGVGCDPQNSSRIIITAKCWDLRIHRALKNLELKLQEELDSLSDQLFQYSKFAPTLPQRVLVSIENIGYEVVDLKFRLQEKEITTLLMGEQLYDRKEAALRELLQNSYDACRHRVKIDPKIKPTILFQLSGDRQRLIVRDNGVGMTRAQIEKYLVRIGSCFYKSKEFLEKDLDFTPISSFGIGLLSYFMISDHISIETKSENDQPFLIEIFGIEDYFLMRKGNNQNIGTTITLFLKEEFGKKLDVEKEIKFYARHLEFPVQIITPEGQEAIIENEPAVPNVGTFIKNEYPASRKYGFTSFSYHQKNYDITFNFLCQKDKTTGLSPINPPWYDRHSQNNQIAISMEGIYVNEIKDLLPSYFNKWLNIDLNLRAGIVDLNISRTAIVKNYKFDSLVIELEKLLIESLKRWIADNEKRLGYAPSLRNVIVITYVSHELFGSSIGRTEIPNDAEASATYLEFFKEFYCFSIFSKKLEYHESYNNLLKTRKKIISLNNFPSDDDYTYAKDLMLNCTAFLDKQLYFLDNYSYYSYCDFCDSENVVFTRKKSFESMFEKEFVNTALQQAIQKTWKIVKFTNLKTNRIFETLSGRYGPKTLVNSDHKFIALLLNRPDVILKSERMDVLESFFSKFKRDVKNNFSVLIEKQERILQWYLDAGVIKNKTDFLITINELPPYYRPQLTGQNAKIDTF
jgi:hypothetical protein